MRLIRDGEDDPVVRLARFKDAHPEVTIKPPVLGKELFWRAEEDGQDVAGYCYWLRELMNRLEAKYTW